MPERPWFLPKSPPCPSRSASRVDEGVPTTPPVGPYGTASTYTDRSTSCSLRSIECGRHDDLGRDDIPVQSQAQDTGTTQSDSESGGANSIPNHLGYRTSPFRDANTSENTNVEISGSPEARVPAEPLPDLSIRVSQLPVTHITETLPSHDPENCKDRQVPPGTVIAELSGRKDAGLDGKRRMSEPGTSSANRLHAIKRKHARRRTRQASRPRRLLAIMELGQDDRIPLGTAVKASWGANQNNIAYRKGDLVVPICRERGSNEVNVTPAKVLGFLEMRSPYGIAWHAIVQWLYNMKQLEEQLEEQIQKRHPVSSEQIIQSWSPGTNHILTTHIQPFPCSSLKMLSRHHNVLYDERKHFSFITSKIAESQWQLGYHQGRLVLKEMRPSEDS